VQLADVITSFRHHWRAAIAAVLLVAVGLGLFLFLRDQSRAPDRWEASTEILVPARDDKGNFPEDVPPAVLRGQSSLALSSGVTDGALATAGLDKEDPDDFTFDFGSNQRDDLFTLRVTAPTEEQARDLSNGYAIAFMGARRGLVAAGSNGQAQAAEAALTRLQQRFSEVEAALERIDPDLLASLPDSAEPLDEETATGEADLGVTLPPTTPIETQKLVYERADLLRKIESARRTYAQSSTDTIVPDAHASIVERITPEDITPEPPTPLIPIGVAVGIAVLLALGIPVLRDRVDHSIRDSHAAGVALSAPVLSTIPAPPPSHMQTLARPGSPRSHAYRTLAAASVATDQLPRAIVVSAPVGQMQDSVAANFAAALADLGLRVVLVPTDRRQAWYAEAPNGALTLPDFLAQAHSGRLNGEVPHQLQPTPVDNLRILPHGDTEADALIDGLPPLLRAFNDGGVDVTVIAAPSILEDPSATILAWSTRSVLWVVETGEVTQQQASEAAAKLELAGASPFGVAVVDGKG
jgi:Mrp family chromosome partitioning ATPase